jgi:LysM repeat protein/Tol biopolymer transport system component
MSTPSIRIVGFLIVASMLLVPTGAQAAPETQGETVHVVQWGETISIIASRYGVTVEAILVVNGLSDPNFVYVGQRLTIPTSSDFSEGGQHVVARGETLTSIALRYGTTVGALASANGLRDTDFIYAGQILIIPGGASPGSPPPPGSGGCAVYHTVQYGDTLSGIAWQYGTTTNALMQTNNLYSDIIYQGQRLCIPQGGVATGPSNPPPSRPTSSTPPSQQAPSPKPAPPPEQAPKYTYYTVRPGDTLVSIARRFGINQEAIMRANNISNPNFVYTGQRLIIPGVSPPARQQPGIQFANAKIAFARWDGGRHDLYLANLNGSHEKLLLIRAAGPSWSPDGQMLSFYGEEGVDRQKQDGAEVEFEGISNGVLVVPAANWPEDLSQLKLTQIVKEGTARATAWSPNGHMIAWDANPAGGFNIFFHGEEGTDFEAQSAIQIPGEHPDWSPDSNQIVYRSGRDGKQGLWVSDRFDSVAHRITEDGTDAFPRWSPDGKWIAFQREAEGNVDIYLMPAPGAQPPDHPDKGRVRRLTDAQGPDTLPAWTPDGRHIVFRSARDGIWGIYIMNADGGGQQQIIPYGDPGPDWTFGRMDIHPLN